MRGSVEDGLRRRRGLDGGGDVSNVVREEKERGDTRGPRASPYLVPASVAPGRRVWRARRRRMVMLEITQG